MRHAPVGRRLYLLLVRAQLRLALLDVVLDVRLELQPAQLDAAGQGIQLLSRSAWDLGQFRVRTQKHMAWLGGSLLGRARLIPSRALAGYERGRRDIRRDTCARVSRTHLAGRLPSGARGTVGTWLGDVTHPERLAEHQVTGRALPRRCGTTSRQPGGRHGVQLSASHVDRLQWAHGM
jgi:hypothetical protein